MDRQGGRACARYISPCRGPVSDARAPAREIDILPTQRRPPRLLKRFGSAVGVWGSQRVSRGAEGTQEARRTHTAAGLARYERRGQASWGRYSCAGRTANAPPLERTPPPTAWFGCAAQPESFIVYGFTWDVGFVRGSPRRQRIRTEVGTRRAGERDERGRRESRQRRARET